MAATWIQFAILLVAIIAGAVRNGERLSKIETKLDPLWLEFINSRRKTDERRTDTPDQPR